MRLVVPAKYVSLTSFFAYRWDQRHQTKRKY